MTHPLQDKLHNWDDTFGLALAQNTRIAYDKGWSRYLAYCQQVGLDPLSANPSQVAEFFLDMGAQISATTGKRLSMSTLDLYRSAINRRYVEADQPSPTHHPKVRAVMKALARRSKTLPRRVLALREYHIMSMLEQCQESLIGLRDAALIALGFSAALRRSELCALTVDALQILPARRSGQARRMFLNIHQSKTDQTGRGQRIAIPEGQTIQPIQRLETWLRASGIRRGYVFQALRRGYELQGRPLHHSDVARLLKLYARRIGLNPDEIAGHSLRAGFVTSAAVHHARLDKIMAITRHNSTETVMRYVRDVEAFEDHAGKDFL